MSIQPKTVLMSSAVTRICEEMGLPDDVLSEVFLLESLRIQLWALSRGGEEAANGRRITNRAEKQLQIFGKPVRERHKGIREYLRDLQAIGDAVHCGDDNWLPSPSRIVLAGSLRLFVGGVPTFLLPATLRDEILHMSPVRTVRGVVDSPAELPYQDLDRWLGRPITSAEEQVRRMHDAPLSPVSESGGTWQCYVVRNWSEKPPWYNHRSRFTDISKVVDGRYLAWWESATVGRPGYWIIQVKQGVVTSISHERVSPDDVHQLLLSINHVSQFPLKMQILHTYDGLPKLEQRCRLPSSEENLLTAIAVRETVPDKRFPVFWLFSDDSVVAEVTTQLERLGIAVEHHHETTGDNR